jgi:hypothetical protein
MNRFITLAILAVAALPCFASDPNTANRATKKLKAEIDRPVFQVNGVINFIPVKNPPNGQLLFVPMGVPFFAPNNPPLVAPKKLTISKLLAVTAIDFLVPTLFPMTLPLNRYSPEPTEKMLRLLNKAEKLRHPCD